MATNRLAEKDRVDVYANTLFDSVASQGEAQAVDIRNQISSIRALIYENIDLVNSLETTDYTGEQRYEIAKSVFADSDPALREVLAVMAEMRDMELLARVYHAYEEIMFEKLHVCVIDVTTYVELDDNLRQQIREKAEADLGCKAVLNESIDKSILGGIIMSARGMRIDASILSQLNSARHTLKE